MRRIRRKIPQKPERQHEPALEKLRGRSRPFAAVMGLVGLQLLIGLIDGSVVFFKFATRYAKPLGLIFFRFVKKFFLGSILSFYFLILKIKLKLKDKVQTGRYKLFGLFNGYLFRATIVVIIVITLVSNIGSRNINAEELRSTMLITSVIHDTNEETTVLIEEGSLQSTSSLAQNYADDDAALFDEYIVAPYAPDTDDDDLYATTEGESAIVAPLLTDPDGDSIGPRDSIEQYVVQDGDTISTIAQQFGVSINTILWQNSLNASSTIRPGQALTILPVSGVQHTIASGETIGQIAKKYQADVEEIIVQNKLADAGDIRAGDKLIIPDGIRPTAVALQPRSSKSLPTVIKDIFVPPSAPIVDSGTKLFWPLGSKRITQYFHLRHSGVDVGDKAGNPIYAAEAGKVERAGWTRGYGYNIVINHGNGLKTLYGHASKLLVGVGDSVSRGDTVALIGSTGWSTGPHLHFEIISNGSKTNPLNYIQ